MKALWSGSIIKMWFSKMELQSLSLSYVGFNVVLTRGPYIVHVYEANMQIWSFLLKYSKIRNIYRLVHLTKSAIGSF